MVEYRGVWSRDEVTRFLETTEIPVRIGTLRPDGSQWIVPLWFRYRAGMIECATAADAHVVDFLRATPDVAFDVSTNTIPYRGIRGTGTVSITEDTDKAVLRALVDRYLGDSDSRLATTLLDTDRNEVCLQIEPQEVYSWDFTARMSDINPLS